MRGGLKGDLKRQYRYKLGARPQGSVSCQKQRIRNDTTSQKTLPNIYCDLKEERFDKWVLFSIEVWQSFEGKNYFCAGFK